MASLIPFSFVSTGSTILKLKEKCIEDGGN
jgi:hypothetical protein